MRLRFDVTLCSAGLLLACGQPTLQGRVLTAAGDPVVGASVIIVGTSQIIHTDSLGEFAFSQLPADLFGVQVRATGYRTAECPLQGLIRESRFRCDVWLQPDSARESPPVSARSYTRDPDRPSLSAGARSAEGVFGPNPSGRAQARPV